MESLLAKIGNKSHTPVFKKLKQEKKKTVATKPTKKKVAASKGAGAEEQNPLLEQGDEEKVDANDSDKDVFEDALTETAKKLEEVVLEEQEEEEEIVFDVSDKVPIVDLEKAAPSVQIRHGAIWKTTESLWAKIGNGSPKPDFKKVNQEKKKTVATKPTNKKVAASKAAGAEEQYPLLEQSDEEQEDDSDKNVVEDALTETSKKLEEAVLEEQVEEEEEIVFAVSDKVPIVDLERAAPSVQIRHGAIWNAVERIWTKFGNGSHKPVFKKVNQEKKETVATKPTNKKVAASKGAGAEEQKPLREQSDEKKDDANDSDKDVVEDALTETSKQLEVVLEEQVEEGEENLLAVSDKVPNVDLEKAAPSVQIRYGAIWGGLEYSQLNALALRKLKEPMRISPRRTYLYLGQQTLIITAYFKLLDSIIRFPFSTSMAISVSYTDHILYSTCINNGLVTAAAVTFPRARSVFCIKPARPLEVMPHIQYGQPIILQLIGSATPIYLTGGTHVAPDKSCPVRVSPLLNGSCYFKFVNYRQKNKNTRDYYPVPSDAEFLIQHVESNLFLTFESHNWVSTTFGMENTVKLQPLECVDKSVSNQHIFKAFVN